MSGLANHESAFRLALEDHLACSIIWKLASKDVKVAGDRRAELVIQSPAKPVRKVRLSNRRFPLA
jgi:hypothetical protein